MRQPTRKGHTEEKVKVWGIQRKAAVTISTVKQGLNVRNVKNRRRNTHFCDIWSQYSVGLGKSATNLKHQWVESETVGKIWNWEEM